MEKKIVVACAIMRNAPGQILLCRRALGRREAGLWEFPGGKVEAGESVEQALARELQEELSITCPIGAEVCRTNHSYSHGDIELVALETTWLGQRILLRDHDQLAWVRPDQLLLYDLAPADKPIARYLSTSGTGMA